MLCNGHDFDPFPKIEPNHCELDFSTYQYIVMITVRIFFNAACMIFFNVNISYNHGMITTDDHETYE